MSRERVYWFATKNAVEGERDPPGQTRELLQRLFRNWHEPVQALIAASQEDSILRNDIYDIDPLPNFVQGRAGLLGDAAHAMTPNLGQGACQAMEDGILLAACLKKSSRVDSGLLEYERRRMPRTRQFVLRARRLGVIAQWENPALCWLRDTAMRATPKQIAARQMKLLLDFEILARIRKGPVHEAGGRPEIHFDKLDSRHAPVMASASKSFPCPSRPTRCGRRRPRSSRGSPRRDNPLPCRSTILASC